MKFKSNFAPKRLLALGLTVVMLASLASCKKKEEKPAEVVPGTSQTSTVETIKEVSEFSAPTFLGGIREAKAKNTDIVGWLQIPDTKIDGAVVQAKDNAYYQRKNEWKDYSWTGTYFADYESNMTDRASLSKNSIIYGHNVHYDDDKTKERFSQLFHFTDLDFAKKHPYVYFSLDDPSGLEKVTKPGQNADNEMVWQIFSVFYTKTDFNYIQVKKDPLSTDAASEEMTEAQLVKLAEEAKLRSEYTYDVDVTGKDKIITLSTCSYKYGRRNDVRFVVMAKLLDQDAALKSTVDISENKGKKAVE